ncbi:hypothetical protein F2P81_015249 [Scophthalmus maximus]|uniref:Uncharacterized protein n=1 Tax=Scophthalmus maximus TaxID=52904 RepID=A0A6A4SK72_SCOMX|nr:hypothetical protein F2P81_015249 [Scophthalmus maximus]
MIDTPIEPSEPGESVNAFSQQRGDEEKRRRGDERRGDIDERRGEKSASPPLSRVCLRTPHSASRLQRASRRRDRFHAGRVNVTIGRAPPLMEQW